MANVAVKTADGTIFEIASADYDRAIASGKYYALSPEDHDILTAKKAKDEAESVTGKIKTFGENAAIGAYDLATAPVRGAMAGAEALGVPGMGTALEQTSGRQVAENFAGLVGAAGSATTERAAREYAEAARARSLENPWTALGGQVAGQIAVGAGMGAVAAPAVAAEAAPSLAATVGRTALRTGIESALIGGPVAEDAAYLEKRRLTGEQYLAATGLSAIVGAGLGAGGSLVARAFGRGVPAATQLAGEISVPATEAKAVSQVEMRTKGLIDKIVGRSDADISETIATQTGRAAEDGVVDAFRKIVSGKTTAQVAEEAHLPIAKAIVEDLEPSVNGTHELVRRIINTDLKRKDVAHLLETAGVNESVALALAKENARLFQEGLDEALINPVTKNIAILPKKVQRVFDEYRQAIGEHIGHVLSTDSAADAYIALDEARRMSYRQATQLRKFSPNPQDMVARNILADQIVGRNYDRLWEHLMNETVWGAQGTAQKAVNNAFVKLISAEKNALPGLAISLETQYEGAGKVFDVYSANSRPIWNLVQNAGKFEANTDVQKAHQLFDAMAQFSGAMTQYGTPEAAKIAKTTATAANRLTVNLNAAAQVGKAIEQAGQVVKKAEVQSTIFGTGVIGSIATTIVSPAKRMSLRLHVQHTADTASDMIGGAVRSWLGGTAGAAGKVAISTAPIGRAARYVTADALFRAKNPDAPKAYKERRDEIYAITDDGGARIREGLAAHLGEAVDGDPGILVGATNSATAGAMFLRSKFDVPAIATDSLTPKASAPIPNDLDVAKVARYWEMVERPLEVLKRDLPRHALTAEHVEALKAVYPTMYKALQGEVLAQIRDLDAKGKKLDIRARAQADLLLGLGGAGDRVLSPSFGGRWGAKMGDETGAPPVRPRALKGPAMPKTMTDKMLEGGKS